MVTSLTLYFRANINHYKEWILSKFVLENLRLKELVLVNNKNKLIFEEFVCFLNNYGYKNIYEFVNEKDEAKIFDVIHAYFHHNFSNRLFDGIARPYDEPKSKWYLITWILRDAPQQRLQPILRTIPAKGIERNIILVCNVLKFASPLFPEKASWEWPAISEIMIQRLEGSRRSLKGNLFEVIVREQLKEIFEQNNLAITVVGKEIRLHEETYDIEIKGQKETILMPVKTRETAGGGHSTLFTRDIDKSISVASRNGYKCIPVVIAESWSGNLESLLCENFIYMNFNPNQIDELSPLLKKELEKLIPIFKSI